MFQRSIRKGFYRVQHRHTVATPRIRKPGQTLAPGRARCDNIVGMQITNVGDRVTVAQSAASPCGHFRLPADIVDGTVGGSLLRKLLARPANRRQIADRAGDRVTAPHRTHRTTPMSAVHAAFAASVRFNDFHFIFLLVLVEYFLDFLQLPIDTAERTVPMVRMLVVMVMMHVRHRRRKKMVTGHFLDSFLHPAALRKNTHKHTPDKIKCINPPDRSIDNSTSLQRQIVTHTLHAPGWHQHVYQIKRPVNANGTHRDTTQVAEDTQKQSSKKDSTKICAPK